VGAPPNCGIAAKEHKAAEPQPKKLKLTQRRKGAKERQKPRQQEFTTETQRTLRTEARGLIKISSPFYLCGFAALREFFSVFVAFVIFPYCDLRF
jgi:hypothetical protein